MESKNVLVVDDDQIIRHRLTKELERNFFTTFQAADGKTALETLLREKIDIIVLDVLLPDINGLDVLSEVKQKHPDCEVIVITGHGSQDIAVQSLKRGAIDYVEKPIKMDEFSTALGRACEKILNKEILGFTSSLLIIDDDPQAVAHLKRALKKEGYKVFAAGSGTEGLNTIEQNKIDVVLTDIQMADMNGIEVLKQAKQMYADIECIMITGHREDKLPVESLRAGAFDYLIKPVDLEELLISIQKALERIHLNRNRLYRDRELKISSDIITKMNEELEHKIEVRTTEMGQMQAQLFQTSKLATLGEMSAGLAHEINQPLGGISLVAQSMRKLMDRDRLTPEEICSGLDDITTSVERIDRIIRHIRTFARQDTLKFIEVDVHKTIDHALSLLGEQLRLRGIKLVLDLAPDIPPIYGEPYQLEQVWINLISNARDSLLAQGQDHRKKLTISTRWDQKAGTVAVCFSDNGTGISKESREKVFDPFFTTKAVGKATGLGLSISHGIIENHRGKIALKSKKGKGAAFTVTLSTETLPEE